MLKLRISHFISTLYLLLWSVTPVAIYGQEVSHEVMIGTQFPVQLGVGYQLNLGKHFSGRAQAGLLLPPYDKFIIYSMEAFGFNKKYSKALDEAFTSGLVAGVSPQYRFGNNYFGIQGLYTRLKGSISVDEAAELLLENQVDLPDLNQLPIRLPDFSTKSHLVLAGIHYGRTFYFANPKLALSAEIGFNKIIGSQNEYTTNIRLVDNLAQVYYQNLDKRLNSYYLTYGYIPNISLYLVYTLTRSQNNN